MRLANRPLHLSVLRTAGERWCSADSSKVMSRHSRYIEALVLLLSSTVGCADSVTALAGDASQPVDAAVSADGGQGALLHSIFCEHGDGAGLVGAGMWATASTGCANCRCSRELGDAGQVGGDDSSRWELVCDQNACPGPPSNVGPEYPSCSGHSDCSPDPGSPRYHVCVFNSGCVSPSGYCMRGMSRCMRLGETAATPGEGEVFCGCDGVTYSGNCPVVPYRHAGPCQE